MTFKIVDCAADVTRHLPALKAAGVETVIRYLSEDTRPISKNVRSKEARAIAAEKLRLGLVWETFGGTHRELSAALGVRHASMAIAQAKAVGAPDGACIYFACDTNPVGAFFDQVMEYFASVNQTLKANSKYLAGIYGPGKVCDAALDAGHVDKAWLANAHGWSGYQEFLASKRWVLLQHLPTHVAGLSCDPDEAAAGADIGDFVPFAAAPAETTDPSPAEDTDPPHDLKWVQEQMKANGFDPGPADGTWGPKTEAAVVAMMEQLLVTDLPSQP
jgi:Rv2525c-like, glycoside hydrolase-like domain/Putative peptidoglycan binding domain